MISLFAEVEKVVMSTKSNKPATGEPSPAESLDDAIIAGLMKEGAIKASVGPRDRKQRKVEEKLVAISDIKGGFVHTPVNRWNRRHWRGFLESKYQAMFNDPWLPGYQYLPAEMTRLEAVLSKALGRTVEPAEVKSYVELFFAEYAKKIVGNGHQLTVKSLHAHTPAITAFANGLKRPPVQNDPGPFDELIEAPLADALDRKDCPSVEEVSNNARISFRSVLLSYGLAIPIRWAMRVKGVSQERAVAGVRKAAMEAVEAHPKYWENIAGATEGFGPYPAALHREVSALAEGIRAESEAKMGHSLRPLAAKICDSRGDADLLA